MRISKIENQKRRGRWNIYADGEFLTGVSEETLLLFGLRTGDELRPDQVDALRNAESRTMARQSAMRLLAQRPRTVREIRDRLREKEFPDGDITAVIEELQRTGLLNDVEFAEMYIRDQLTLRPAGKLLIRRKLLLLGVDKSIADRATEQAFQTHSQEDSASALGRNYLRKARSVRTPKDRQQLRKRLSGFLGRRGYPWDTIQHVLHELFDEEQDAEDSA